VQIKAVNNLYIENKNASYHKRVAHSRMQ